MTKVLSFLLLISVWLGSYAQSIPPTPQVLSHPQVVDTAQYKVTYSLKYRHHPGNKDYFDDTRIILIGRSHLQDYSDIIQYFDSLRTEAENTGASTYSNVNGNPWPVEILTESPQHKATLKYRLPLETGILKYQEEVPGLSWEFQDSDPLTIIGYECSKATTEFAGRKYTAWFATEIPLPFGPYKFGGLPGLILRIEDSEKQFVWQAEGLEKSSAPVNDYSYDIEKSVSTQDADKAIRRSIEDPLAFLQSFLGSGKIMVKGKDGRFKRQESTSSEVNPYKPLELK